MKRILIVALLFVSASMAFAQSKKDSVEVLIDTINIKGKVIDEHGKPVYNALVLSENSDKNHNYIRTKTNKDGLFFLNGITPKNTIRVRADKVAVEQTLNGSRYLLITLSPLSKLNLKADEQHWDISAKRISSKLKYSFKVKDTIVNYSFHPFGHYSPANFPGGIYKFYSFIQKNVVYPEKAIKNNIEGTVVIEFTVDKIGNLKDFLVVRDIGYGCADEILRVIKTSRKWNAAMNGLPVEQRICIEIPFKLID